jgi:hypothetical protein
VRSRYETLILEREYERVEEHCRRNGSERALAKLPRERAWLAENHSLSRPLACANVPYAGRPRARERSVNPTPIGLRGLPRAYTPASAPGALNTYAYATISPLLAGIVGGWGWCLS